MYIIFIYYLLEYNMEKLELKFLKVMYKTASSELLC